MRQFEFLAIYALWAALHSLSMSRTAKRLARGLLGNGFRYYRLGFTLAAALSFAAALGLAPRLEENVYRFQGAAAWGLWLIRLAGAAFFLWTCTNVDLKAFTGLRQASGSPEAALADDGEPADARRLNTSGPYGIVRHPMYTAAIVMLFTEPHMTIEKLLFAVFATVYFAVGSVFEERRLIDVFGQEYLDYRERTPRLVPGFVRPGRKP